LKNSKLQGRVAYVEEICLEYCKINAKEPVPANNMAIIFFISTIQYSRPSLRINMEPVPRSVTREEEIVK